MFGVLREAVGYLCFPLVPFLHVIPDETYLEPGAFLGLFYGFAFEITNLDNFAGKMLPEIHADVTLYVPEMIGPAILASFVLLLVRRSGYLLSQGWEIYRDELVMLH
jgi:hypothetical protein